MVYKHFVKDQLSQDLLVQRVLFELEVKVLDLLGIRVLPLVQVLEVRMPESLCGGEALLRVVLKQLAQEVFGFGLKSRHQFGEFSSGGLSRSLDQEIPDRGIRDLTHDVFRRKPPDFNELLELML